MLAAGVDSLQLSGGYIAVADAPNLDLEGDRSLTIEMWFRRDRTTSACETLISSGGPAGFELSICDNQLHFTQHGPDDFDFNAGSDEIPANLWTHVAVRQEGFGPAVLVNGDRVISAVNVSGPEDNDLPLIIGGRQQGTSVDQRFRGEIAEARLWSVSRSVSEILDTMHVVVEEPLPGLIANWSFSESLADPIGGHDAVLVGSAGFTGPASPPERAVAPVDESFGELSSGLSHAATASLTGPFIGQALLIGGHDGDALQEDILRVDGATGVATAIGALPEPLRAPAAAWAENVRRVFVFGGQTDSLPHSEKIYSINPATGEATELAAVLPEAFSTAAAVFHPPSGMIYLFGGEQGSGASAALRDAVLAFDPVSEQVSALPVTLPQPTADLAAAYSSATESVYLFGGRTGAGADDAVLEFSVDQTGPSLTAHPALMPQAADALTAVEDPSSNLLYLAGGHHAGTDDGGRILVFDPLTGELWSTRISLPERREHAAGVYVPQSRHLLLLGGQDNEEETERTIWRIALGDGPAVPLGDWNSAPNPVPLGAQEITAIDGDGHHVVVGTSGNGAAIINAERQVRPIRPADLNGAQLVHDVAYNADTNTAYIATGSAGLFAATEDDVIQLGDASTFGVNNITAVDFDHRPPTVFFTPTIIFAGTSSEGLWGRFSLLGPENILPGQFISDVVVAEPGVLYALANNNLHRITYSTTEFTGSTNLGRPCVLLNSSAEVAVLDGDIWVGAPGGSGEFDSEGLCRVPGAAPASGGAEISTGLGERATGLSVDSDGRLWVSFGNDFNNFDSGGLAAFETADSTSANAVRTSEFNWLNAPIGTNDVHSVLNSDAWASGFMAVGGVDERVWAGRTAGGFRSYAPRWQQVLESNNLDEKSLSGVWMARGRAFFADDDELFVLQPDGATWDNRDLAVHEVFADGQGRIWLGAGDGPRLYQSDGFDLLEDRVGAKPDGPTRAVVEDMEGRIWIGGEDGLTLFDRNRFILTLTTENSNLPDNSVRALTVDRQNRLWVGTDNGLARLDVLGGDFILFRQEDGAPAANLPSHDIHDLASLPDGSVAVSTAAGLTVFNDDAFRRATQLPDEIDEADLPLSVDHLGRLWAGAAVRNGSRWQGYYWTNSGLIDSTVADVAADGADRVWFVHGAAAEGASMRGAHLPPLSQEIPIPESISPQRGAAGDVITINGSGFGEEAGDLMVFVGGQQYEPLSVAPTEIRVEIDALAHSGDVTISRGGRTSTLFAAFQANPTLERLSHGGGNVGVLIDVYGENIDPASQISIGGGPFRPIRRWQDATHFQFIVEPQDGDGAIVVRNHNPDNPDNEAVLDSPSFNKIELSLPSGSVTLNQGIQSYGLVNAKPTVVSHYLVDSEFFPNLISSNHLVEVDRLELVFTNPETGESETLVQRFDNPAQTDLGARIPVNPGGLFLDVRKADITNAVNLTVRPDLDELIEGPRNLSGNFGLPLPLAGTPLEVHSRLTRRGRVVAEHTQTAPFRPNVVTKALLVPLMSEGFTSADVHALKSHINPQLGDLQARMFPSGRMFPVWSQYPVTVQDAVGVDQVTIDPGIEGYWQLYQASHELDRARRWHNQLFDGDARIAFGVVENSAVKEGGGLAFWPDLTETLNFLALDVADLLCDVGDAALNFISFGALGGDGCNISIPSNVGWAGSASGIGDASSLFGHEFGHTFNLVSPFAPNGNDVGFDPDLLDGLPLVDVTDNFSHSLTDELDGGTRNEPRDQTTFNPDRTIYRQPGVSQHVPVVNPLGLAGMRLTGTPSQTQLLPQLAEPMPDGTCMVNGTACRDVTTRAKALMSYAVHRNGDNAFFEPVDAAQILQEVGLASYGQYVRNLTVNGEGERQPDRAESFARAASAPVVEGKRLYVSGLINREEIAGEIERVETLGNQGNVDLSIESGYWMVQLDAAGNELRRTGLLPFFRASADGESSHSAEDVARDVGFFSATLLAHDDVAQLQLLDGDAVLDTFASGVSPPTVEITAPAAGASFHDGNITLSWNASDPDGDPLDVVALYSTDDGASFTPVAFPENVSSIDLPVELLGGGASARFQIMVSDGFHQASALSESFSVAAQPPQPYIQRPSAEQQGLEGQPVLLLGAADDLQDQTLAGDALRWSSDLDGFLGAGEQLTPILSVGTHTLTLEATNSAGLTAVDTIRFTVESDYDLDGVADALEEAVGMNPLFNDMNAPDEDDDGMPPIMEMRWGTDSGNADSDGDGRNDGQEILDGTIASQADNPLPADELAVWPPVLVFEADLAKDVPYPQEIVSVTSRDAADWSLSADVPWLGASASSGRTPQGVSILADVHLLEEGSHTGVLTFTSSELNDTFTVPVMVEVVNADDHYDVNGDGAVNADDKDAVAAAVGMDNTQEDFDRRFDLDRDGDVDQDDCSLLDDRRAAIADRRDPHDIDGNGLVNISDLLTLVRHVRDHGVSKPIAEVPTAPNVNLDADRNEQFTINDILVVVRKLRELLSDPEAEPEELWLDLEVWPDLEDSLDLLAPDVHRASRKD